MKNCVKILDILLWTYLALPYFIVFSLFIKESRETELKLF